MRTEDSNSLDLKRFARHGGPDLSDLRGNSGSEAGVMSEALQKIIGTTEIIHERDQLSNNFGDWPIGNLKKGFREELRHDIVPSRDDFLPILPNYFYEGIGPKGRLDMMELQALRDGAEGARCVQAIRNSIDPASAYDGNTYTITSVYHPTLAILAIYTVHAVGARGKPIQLNIT
ncbi:MAG: hypothetical protein Q9184_001671 [Pyrenodesmia sp. 2 TL-2023]